MPGRAGTRVRVIIQLAGNSIQVRGSVSRPATKAARVASEPVIQFRQPMTSNAQALAQQGLAFLQHQGEMGIPWRQEFSQPPWQTEGEIPTPTHDQAFQR